MPGDDDLDLYEQMGTQPILPEDSSSIDNFENNMVKPIIDPYEKFMDMFGARDLNEQEKFDRARVITYGSINNINALEQLKFKGLSDVLYGRLADFKTVKESISSYDEAKENYSKHWAITRFFSHIGLFPNVAKERENIERMEQVFEHQGLKTPEDIQAVRDGVDFPSNVIQTRENEKDERNKLIDEVCVETRKNFAISNAEIGMLSDDQVKLNALKNNISIIRNEKNEIVQSIENKFTSEALHRDVIKNIDKLRVKDNTPEGREATPEEKKEYKVAYEKYITCKKAIDLYVKYPNLVSQEFLDFAQDTNSKYQIMSDINNTIKTNHTEIKNALDAKLKSLAEKNIINKDEVDEIRDRNMQSFFNPNSNKEQVMNQKEFQQELAKKIDAPNMNKNDLEKKSGPVEQSKQMDAPTNQLNA